VICPTYENQAAALLLVSTMNRDLWAGLLHRKSAIHGLSVKSAKSDWLSHSRMQRPRSFLSAPRITTSGLVQRRKSATHGLPVKSGKSDWLRMHNEYSAHAQKMGAGHLSFFTISELAAMKQPNNSLHLPYPTRDTRKIANKVMTVASDQINSQSKHDLICHVAKVKATTSAHSMAT